MATSDYTLTGSEFPPRARTLPLALPLDQREFSDRMGAPGSTGIAEMLDLQLSQDTKPTCVPHIPYPAPPALAPFIPDLPNGATEAGS